MNLRGTVGSRRSTVATAAAFTAGVLLAGTLLVLLGPPSPRHGWAALGLVVASGALATPWLLVPLREA